MAPKTYEDGIQEGRLRSLENIAAAHKDRLDSQAKRLRVLERVVWASGGIMVFLNAWPTVGRALLAAVPTAAGAGPQ